MRKLVLSTLVLTLAAFGKQSALAADLDSLKLRVGHGAVEEAPSSAPSGPTHPFFRHRLMLQGGAASNKIVSSAAVGTVSGTAGTRFLFEDDLGFASSKMTLDALLRFRLSGRWMIEGEYFGISRDNAAIISRNIQFGPSSFPASAAVNADLNMATYRLALGYAFAKTENFELGGALSLYLLDFSALLRGNATFGGFVASFQTEKFGVPAPLPTIGVYGHYALTSRWLISARVDYTDFSLSTSKWFGDDLSNVGGRVLSLEANTEYRLLDNLGVGIGYRYFDFSIGAATSDLRGGIGYRISAPMAFVRASF